MYVQVRLYAKHDLDILAYAALPFVKLDDLMHTCVCAYVRNTPLTLPFQVDLSNGIDIKDQRVCVTFNEKEDADVIDWLNNTRYGYQNAIIKMITRSYFPSSVINDIYIIHDGTPVKPALQVKPVKKESNDTISNTHVAKKTTDRDMQHTSSEPTIVNPVEHSHTNNTPTQNTNQAEIDPVPIVSTDVKSVQDNLTETLNEDDTFDMFESIGDSLMV